MNVIWGCYYYGVLWLLYTYYGLLFSGLFVWTFGVGGMIVVIISLLVVVFFILWFYILLLCCCFIIYLLFFIVTPKIEGVRKNIWEVLVGAFSDFWHLDTDNPVQIWGYFRNFEANLESVGLI